MKPPTTILGTIPGDTVHELPMGTVTNSGLKHVFILSRSCNSEIQNQAVYRALFLPEDSGETCSCPFQLLEATCTPWLRLLPPITPTSASIVTSSTSDSDVLTLSCKDLLVMMGPRG